MLVYIVRRLVQAIPIVLLVITITFTLGFYGPGDPIRSIFAQNVQVVDEATIQRIRNLYGLNRPFPVQLGDYMGRLIRGDFGTSISLRRPVGAAMAHALPISAQIGLAALGLIVLIGIPLGVIAALRQNSGLDYGIVAGTIILASIPSFVLAPLLMILLILKLNLLSSTVGWEGLLSQKAILPVCILAVGSLPTVVRYTRASILEVLGQEFVRTARAKGLPDRSIMIRHVLRNALAPIVTALGLSVGGLITGSVFLENIFGIPGFGSLVVGGIQGYDYPLVLGTTIVGALLVIGSNLIVDMLYGVLDPRAREDPTRDR
jgi:ABC-type dipeptide/oligopeptide/nickel transport system permease component